MATAIVMRSYGGPEVLAAEEVAQAPLLPGQVRVRHARIGVHYHDVYVRSGEYRTLALPGVPGIEAVGVVTEAGAGVTRWKAGQRVAYVTSDYGAYASERAIAGDDLVAVPDDLGDETVASMLLRGLTVEMLAGKVHALRAGMAILVHAAAGGVGQLLCRWASRLGALVIGAVRSDAQAALAAEAGCAHVLRYQTPNLADAVKTLTHGRGVDVVYDGVGRSTFDLSLACVGVCGHVVSFGQASGAVEPVGMARLAAKSITLTRPILFHYLRDPVVRNRMLARVYDAIRDGWLAAGEPRRFPLRDAAQGHRAMQNGGATTPILLVP